MRNFKPAGRIRPDLGHKPLENDIFLVKHLFAMQLKYGFVKHIFKSIIFSTQLFC